ncbi:SulP family inorganic anion transporter [Achromobacter spanius]|uniref:SulP family inorganic anion transporter n=1 Tax=Achromobacter spanius TaxID=217203 RepID=A0AA42LTW5_9BURK|nr:SulP family inorganic anion transporter [Achromobacter spanius]MDH0739488.1 SulP family inorganic anion transporter [Achromobacter spanius]
MENEPPEKSVRRQHVALPDWLFQYHKPWVKDDVTAGLTTAAVVIPKALAYAAVAGLPVQVGLYTAFVPMLVYAFLGTSRPLSVSTTTTLAILTATALDRAVPGGDTTQLLIATATLALLVGIVLIAASLLRLGYLASFISEPVLVGFKAGIAIVIVVDQIPKLLGLHFPKGPFLSNVLAIFDGLTQVSIATTAVGAITLGLLLILQRFMPRAPAPLVTVAIAIAATSLFGLGDLGVQTVGHVPTGLPSLTLPDPSLIEQLWPMALGIALMSFTETIAAGRAFANAGEALPNANRELLATGFSNVGGALFGAMPAGGGTSQTAVNQRAGARSQVAECVTAAVTLGVMLLLAPLIGAMPHATLAAVVIIYSVGLFDPAEFRAIARVRRTELVWALVALAGVVLLGTLQGILVAIIVSLAALAHQVSNPPLHRLLRKRNTNLFRPASPDHPDDEALEGILLLRPEGRIFFVNADNIGRKITQLINATHPKVVVLDMGSVFDIEYTALKLMSDAERRLRRDGIVLWLANLTPGVLATVRRSPLGAALGADGLFQTVEEAVRKYQDARLHAS